MNRSLFAALRGEDGRSLARALIALVLLSVFAAGLNGGAAADPGGMAICSAAAASKDGGAPPRSHTADCCLVGATPLAMAIAARPPVLAEPVGIVGEAMEAEPTRSARHGNTIRASARGPPLAA
ncbi:MAG: hypothetical protein KDK07_15535 [Bauldia sp.]|nr:hypothetical protein [Bauldia sp.]